MRAPKLIAHLALFIVALIYGANYFIAKSVMPYPIGASAFIFLRVAGATALFWMIQVFNPEKIERKDYWRFLICGLTGVAVNQLFFFKGLALTSLSNASIIMTINPIMVLIMSAVILRIKPNRRKKIGIFFGATGAVLLIILSSTNPIGKDSSAWGDFFILINALSYAIYLVAVKPLMVKYRPLTIISVVFLIGLVFVFPFGVESATKIPWEDFTSWQYFSVGFVILATTFLAYLLNIFALSRVTPTEASSYIYLQPVMALVFAWVFSNLLNEPYVNEITWYKIGCAILIFIGIYLVSFEKNVLPNGVAQADTK